MFNWTQSLADLVSLDMHMRKEFRQYDTDRRKTHTRATESWKFCQSTRYPRSLSENIFLSWRGMLKAWYVYGYHASCRERDRTHPRARACARKGTRPRPEYFIFTYQRWALCAVYIKSRYSYGMSIRQGLHPSRHSPVVFADTGCPRFIVKLFLKVLS